jgi:hypothetical protein
VLAQAVNEGLATGTLKTSADHTLWLSAPNPGSIAGYDGVQIKCGIRTDAYLELDGSQIIGFVRAEDLLTPVLTWSTTGEECEELDPVVLCRIICSWQPELAQSDGGELLINEVQNATNNQGKFDRVCNVRPD